MAADDRTRSTVYALKQRLEALESEKSELLAELARLQRNQDAVAEARAPSAATGSVNAASDAAAKIKLFRSLFRGRDDVFPRRWQNANSGKSGYSPVCRNEWVRGICEKPRVKCGECPHQAFVPVADDVIRSHLQGTDRDASGRQSGAEYIAGVYPLLPDETCWFLAIDFDKQSWQIDAHAFVEACRACQIDCGTRAFALGTGRARLDLLCGAGIVVNGSAELVGHLEVKPDGMRQFDCAGAIDEPPTCKLITVTMEGGEKAFRDRKDKYGY